MAQTDQAGDFQDKIVKELGAFIASKSATFTCGGSIPYVQPNKGSDDPSTTEPGFGTFALRWDANQEIGKLCFPLHANDQAGMATLRKLLEDCQPATFGYKGEDVLDASYRRAAKMDRSAFSIDFCPYEMGIIDTITQVLLPNVGKDQVTNGVRAELYKLNVYEAPSGFFKPHVDTPRSEMQFGSLVVSLPCHHEGGELIVRHAGHEVTFDWGSSKADDKKNTSVQWAAFYSDCEHEVRQVTQGHRITLTYNLYYAPGVGDLAGNCPVMEVQSLPLYQMIREALTRADFMTAGDRYLGVYCQHAYAHSTLEGANALPEILKGADMAVYSIFKALGLKVKVRPVVEVDSEWLGDCYDSDDSNTNNNPDFRGCSYIGTRLHKVITTSTGGFEEPPEEILAEFGGNWVPVTWLIGPTWDSGKNLEMAHLAYGNQAEMGEKYTYAAIIIDVPPADDLLRRALHL